MLQSTWGCHNIEREKKTNLARNPKNNTIKKKKKKFIPFAIQDNLAKDFDVCA